MRAGIVHRDVKPANMLLDARDRLALADFGIALVAREEQLTRTGDILGTMAYISPEQALGQPATPASDRYSLAVVAYELLTGRRPFEADHPAAQARAHVEDEPPPTAPVGLDAVLRRGLAKDPAERWGSAGAFVAALERGLAQAERPAAATAATARAPRPASADRRSHARGPLTRDAPEAPARRSRVPGSPPGRSRSWSPASRSPPRSAARAAGRAPAAGSRLRRPRRARRTARSTTRPPRQRTTRPRRAPRRPPAPAPAGDLASLGAFRSTGYQARLAGRLDEALALDQRVLARVRRPACARSMRVRALRDGRGAAAHGPRGARQRASCSSRSAPTATTRRARCRASWRSRRRRRPRGSGAREEAEGAEGTSGLTGAIRAYVITYARTMATVPDTTAISIGARVKALREAGGLSLRDLAERSGVSAPMLSQVERGETEPDAAPSPRASPPAWTCASRSCCASTRAAR